MSMTFTFTAPEGTTLGTTGTESSGVTFTFSTASAGAQGAPGASVTAITFDDLTGDLSVSIDSGEPVVVGNVKMTGLELLQDLGTLTANTAIDCALGSVVKATIGASLAFTFTAASTGKCRTLTLHLTNAGSYAITWPTAVKWSLGYAPTFSTGLDIVTFTTLDNGVTWAGMLNAVNVS